MSKLFTAGIKVSEFFKQGDGTEGVWLCNSREQANKLQRALHARIYYQSPNGNKPYEGLKLSCNSATTVFEDSIAMPKVFFCVTALLHSELEVNEDAE